MDVKWVGLTLRIQKFPGSILTTKHAVLNMFFAVSSILVKSRDNTQS